MTRSRTTSTICRFFGAAAVLGVGACRSEAPEEDRPKVRELSEAALLDAPETEEHRPGSEPSRCRPLRGTRPVVLAGAGSGKSGGAMEFSGATSAASGFDVGVLRSAAASEASVVRLDLGARAERISLGQIIGQTEPPKLATSGTSTVAVVSDNDASNSTLRLAAIGPRGEVLWGPEIGRGRGESIDFSVALSTPDRGLLVWDRTPRGAARGEIQGLAFNPRTMKELGPVRVLSQRDDDVEAPHLASRRGGYFLLFLSYQPLPTARSAVVPEAVGLVETPPQRLMVQRIDEEGATVAPAVPVSDGFSDAVVFDAVADPGGGLLVAYREAPMDGPMDGSGEAADAHLAVISDSGSIERRAIHSVRDLGAGIPVLLPRAEDTWVYLGGPGGRCLLGRARPLAAGPLELVEEPSLFGAIPLALSGDVLLAARPHGMDLDLELFRCEL